MNVNMKRYSGPNKKDAQQRKVGPLVIEVNKDDELEDLYDWIEECEQSGNCNVLLLKKYEEQCSQFKLLRSDFCVIIASTKQNVLHERGVRTLCVDHISCSSEYDFEATILFAIDNFGMQYTLAFMISDRSDTYVYEVFFTKLKKYLENLKPEVFISYVNEATFNAFKKIMKSEPICVFSSWNVDMVWRDYLRKIKRIEKRKEVYKIIKSLQTETDIAEFNNLYHEAVEQLKEEQPTKEFYKFWLKDFHKKIKLWAYCYRMQPFLDTDLHILEGLHEVLQHSLSKDSEDLVALLESLVKILGKKKTNKGSDFTKADVLRKTILIKSMHKSASQEEFHFEEKSDCWLLECDKSQRIYEIRKLQMGVCCGLKCPQCDICYHTYSCTCTDYFVKNTICKHIHFIHSVYQLHSPDGEENGSDKMEGGTKVDNLKTELLSMAADISNRLDDVTDEDVLCTLRSQLQNSLMLLTYFSEENGNCGQISNKSTNLVEDDKTVCGVKRKNSLIDWLSNEKKTCTSV